MKERDVNTCYLSVVRKGDRFAVVDQDGREVMGLREVSVSASLDDVTYATITFCDASQTHAGYAHLNRDAG